MKVEIIPSIPKGRVVAPPSKSIAHRALICGALSSGSAVKNIALSKDISATLSCLDALGANIDIDGDRVKIGGLDIFSAKDGIELFCDESGSTLRFMLPFCMASGKKITLKGSKRLFERPLTIYKNICREQDIFFDLQEKSVTVCGTLKNGFYKIPGDVSSQFITGLLFALPLLNGVSIIEVTGDFESASYIDLTVDVLKSFGVRIVRANNRFVIQGNQTYKSLEYKVEGDCSNAAFLEALNFIDGEVTVDGISQNTLQGDHVYKKFFEDLKNGCREFDLSDCPDLAPIMFAVASTIGDVTFFGTKRLKIKESDRGNAMREELLKFGIDAEVAENSVYIKKGELYKPTTVLSGHNDHRIVMALSVLCVLTGGVIEGSEAVAKSYPDFFSVLKTLNVGIKE